MTFARDSTVGLAPRPIESAFAAKVGRLGSEGCKGGGAGAV